MFYGFCFLFLLFFMYSILGYITETCFCSFIDKKITFNRGFLVGPYLPIYGICCIVMETFLYKYSDDLIALFIMSMVICTIIEYFTSLIMEKLFKVRWWDYHDKKFNINGRVCLENAVLFGIAGVGVVSIINPFLMSILKMLPKTILIIISLFCIFIFVADLVTTIVTMVKLKINEKHYEKLDATEEIKVELKNSIEKNNFFTTRLLNAFPDLSEINRKEIAEFKKLVNEIKKESKALKQLRKEKIKEYKKRTSK